MNTCHFLLHLKCFSSLFLGWLNFFMFLPVFPKGLLKDGVHSHIVQYSFCELCIAISKALWMKTNRQNLLYCTEKQFSTSISKLSSTVCQQKWFELTFNIILNKLNEMSKSDNQMKLFEKRISCLCQGYVQRTWQEQYIVSLVSEKSYLTLATIMVLVIPDQVSLVYLSTELWYILFLRYLYI